jgi:hypothetical protein
MIRRLIFIIVIVGAATFAFYKLGFFNRETEEKLEKTIDIIEEKASGAIDKIKENTNKD